ncbi:MAG TPA: HAMP domain-containing sensor histidine kinase [Streptosporangiaceae bacterium]
MRTRLIVAFVVVVVLAAIPEAWLISLILRWYPSLAKLAAMPGPISHLLVTQPPSHRALDLHAQFSHPEPLAIAVFCLVTGGLVLAVVTGLAFAASRRVLVPVGRLAEAAQRMSGGDLTVRLESRGRDELARLSAMFNTMATALAAKVGQLEQMEARARQFAADVSHELRTPLTAMTAVADVLGEQPGLTGDAADAARLVSSEIRHLNRLVNDLIEISRFDAGTAQLALEDTDIGACLASCLRARNWAEVVAEVPAGLSVRLDRRRFDVIVANLVGNAVRHGRTPVTVRAIAELGADGSNELAVEVRDHGYGLPRDAMAHVFERFYKADTARARSEGSGLGLAIAWENASLHGGRIDAANHPGGGAVFTVRLPVR